MIIGSANCILNGRFERTINIYPSDPNNGATRFVIANQGQISLSDAWENRLHSRRDLADDFFNGPFLQRLLNNARITEDQFWTPQAIGGNIVSYTRQVELELQEPGQPVVRQMTMTLREFCDLTGLQSPAHVPFFFSADGDTYVPRSDLGRLVTFSVEYHATLGQRIGNNGHRNNISHHTLVFRFNIQ